MIHEINMLAMKLEWILILFHFFLNLFRLSVWLNWCWTIESEESHGMRVHLQEPARGFLPDAFTLLVADASFSHNNDGTVVQMPNALWCGNGGWNMRMRMQGRKGRVSAAIWRQRGFHDERSKVSTEVN